MRLGNLDGRGVLAVEGGAIDIAEATGGRIGPDLQSCIEAFAELAELAPTLTGPVLELDETRMGPPSPKPGQIIAIGMNYREHAREMNLVLPEIPAAFAKFRSALTGPYGDITLPSGHCDHEVEMVLVIGRTTESVTLDNAWSFVAGVTAGEDISDREVQMAAGRQFALGKSFPGFAPIGPWIVSTDEIEDLSNIPLGCAVDGVVVQDAHTSDMVFAVPELLTALCAIITLEPGDIIFTGSPAGAGSSATPQRFLNPGEMLTTWVGTSGEMRHRLVAPTS
ncbi:MAG: fumarylacetoacetate hydrolase family protein [Actinomycetes bacterium]